MNEQQGGGMISTKLGLKSPRSNARDTDALCKPCLHKRFLAGLNPKAQT